MRHSRRGKPWETEVRNILKKDFNTIFVNHFTNTEYMDFCVFCNDKIVLVEAKSRKSKYYYTKNSIDLRNQLREYFGLKHHIETMLEMPCEFWIYFKRVYDGKSEIIKRRFESYGEIPDRM